jgi:hypothetical protein
MLKKMMVAALVLGTSGVAWAQDAEEEEEEERDDGTSRDPYDTYNPELKPEPPEVDLPDPRVETRTLAGVGSGVAYASRGVAEAGGALSFSVANDVLAFAADPMIGYFVLDNFQLSGILGYRHVGVEDDSSNQFSLMIEPSVHLPINNSLFWLGGIGAGAVLADNIDNDPDVDAGAALAPRTGIQILVGRSGLVNFGARYSMILTGIDATTAPPLEGAAVVAFANTFDVQAGYTIMF